MRGDDLREALEALAGDLWRVAPCGCGHRADLHTMGGDGPAICTGGLGLCSCSRSFVSLMQERIRALLDAPTPSEPEATVVEEWGVRTTTHVERVSPSRVAAEERLATLLHNAYLPGVAGWTSAQQDAALVRRTRTTYADRVTEWTEVTDR